MRVIQLMRINRPMKLQSRDLKILARCGCPCRQSIRHNFNEQGLRGTFKTSLCATHGNTRPILLLKKWPMEGWCCNKGGRGSPMLLPWPSFSCSKVSIGACTLCATQAYTNWSWGHCPYDLHYKLFLPYA